MLAEPQRICFERAERPSVVKGDRGESNVLGRKMSQPIKHVTTDLKIGQTVLLRIKDAFSLFEAGYQRIALQHQSPSLRSLRSLRLGL